MMTRCAVFCCGAVSVLLLLLLSCVVETAAAAAVAAKKPLQHQAPIMAIVVEPFAYNPPECVSVWSTHSTTAPPLGAANATSGCVWSIYVKWLEASGIRVLPLPWNAPKERLDYLLDRVNGVLFPGGILQGDDNVTNAYFEVVQYIFNRAVNVYNLAEGDRFVLWGTCQGFELLHAAAAGTMDAISSGFVGVDPKMLPITFIASNASDRLYKGVVPELKSAMTSKPLTLNWHTKGVVPSAYQTFPRLAEYLEPLTTSVDGSGRVFVSSAQGVNDSVRVFVTQFHPERPPTEFDNDLISHDPDALDVSYFLSMQLRSWLAESNHYFENASEANSLVIENYYPVNQGWGIQIYFV